MNPTLVRLSKNISCIVLVALSVLLVFGAFMPVFTVDTDEVPLSRSFTQGYFTRGIHVETFTVGGNHLLSYLKERDAYEIVFTIQNKQENIREYEEEIEKYRENYASSGNENYLNLIEELNAKCDAESEAIQAHLAEISDEEYEHLYALMEKDAFVGTIAFIYGVEGFFDVVGKNMGTTSSYGQNLAPMISTILTIVTMAGAILTTAILTIAIVISALKRIIYLIKHAKDWDRLEVQRAYSSFLPPFMMVLFTFLALMFVFGDAFQIGGGAVLMGIVWLVSNLICTVNNVFAEHNNKSRIILIMKQGLTVVALVAIVVACAAFYRLDFTGRYLDTSDAPGEAYVDTYIENTEATPDMDADDIYYAALKAAEKKVERNNAMILGGAYLTALFLAIALFSLVERSGMRVASRKYGAPRPYGHQLPLAILLAVLLTFGLNSFLAQTPEARDEALEEGNYAALVDAHLIEETEEYVAYHMALEARTEASAKIAELTEDRQTLTDQDAIAELDSVLIQYKKLLAQAEDLIHELESFSSQVVSRISTFIVMLVVLELLYIIAPKILEKVLPDFRSSAAVRQDSPRTDAPRFGGANNGSSTNDSQYGNVNFKL